MLKLYSLSFMAVNWITDFHTEICRWCYHHYCITLGTMSSCINHHWLVVDYMGWVVGILVDWRCQVVVPCLLFPVSNSMSNGHGDRDLTSKVAISWVGSSSILGSGLELLKSSQFFHHLELGWCHFKIIPIDIIVTSW